MSSVIKGSDGFDTGKLSNLPRPTKTSTNSVTMFDGTVLTVASPVAGTDYYINLEGGSYVLGAKGATTIGGFHYGLTGVAEAPTGNKTEADMVEIRGINSYSIWAFGFRPVCEPEGMVHIGGKWYDIYLLNSEHIVNGTSKSGATIAGGAITNGRAIPKIPLMYGGDGSLNYGKFTWFQAWEIAKSHSKELITYSEFPTIAYGVSEQQSSANNGYEVVVGAIEHYANLTSKFGIEQATGTQWICGKDVGGNRSENSTAWAWRTGLTDSRGDIYALHNNHITGVILGACRDHGANAGSRSSLWDYYVWNAGWSVGCRFASDHKGEL